MTSTSLPTIPGFFADPGKPYQPGSCAQWLDAFGLEGVPATQELPTPLGLRIHDWERDWPHASQAINEAIPLGFTPHLNVMPQANGLSTTLSNVLKAQGVILSVGNSTQAGSGYQYWSALDDSTGHEVQDDSGVRSAVANLTLVARDVLDPTTLPQVSYHAYGNAGDRVFHIGLLRTMFKDAKITLMELHWGFRGRDSRGQEYNKSDKPYLYDHSAGAYIFDMIAAAHANKMDCCLFSFRDFFTSDGQLEESMQVLTGRIPREGLTPYVSPTAASVNLAKGMLRRRIKPL